MGGGDPGLSVLRGALVWGSTLDQTVVEENITYSLSGEQGAVLTAGGADPWGGTTAYTLRGTNATASAPRLACTGITTAGSGALYTAEFWTAVHPDVTATPVRWLPFLRADSPGYNAIDFKIPYNPAITGAGTDAALYGSIVNDASTGLFRRADTYKAGSTTVPWLRVRAKWSGTDGFRVQGVSHTQDGTNLALITAPVITRRSVSAMANLATGSAATITQGTAALRPELDIDEWVDGEDVLFTDGHDGYLGVSTIHTALSGASVAWSASFLLDFRKVWRFVDSASTTGGPILRLIGSTASLAIEQTATSIRVVRVDDAAASTTATMPVTWIEGFAHAVTLVCNGSTIQLYVDGRAVGSAQAIGTATATFTSARVMGASHTAVGEWAMWNRALTATQVSQQASTLARRRGLDTDPIRLWFGKSQSNGDLNAGTFVHPNDNTNAIWMLDESVQFPYQHSSLFALKRYGDTAYPSLYVWGRPRTGNQYAHDSATNDVALNYGPFGVHVGFLAGRGHRTALVHYSRLGVSITQLLPGGDAYSAMHTFYAEKLAELDAAGLAYEGAGMLAVYGEADSATDAEALLFIDRLEESRTDIETEYGLTLPVVAIPRLNDGIDAGNLGANTMRLEMAAWEAADPGARVLVNTDDQSLRSDNVHYTNAMSMAVGQRLGLFSNRVMDLDESVQTILGSTLHTWFRADSTTTNGSGRFRWTDLSGNGRHADSPSAGADPTVSTDANLNGESVVVFDGSTDYLVSTAASSAYTALHNGVARATVWVVCRPTAHGYAIPCGTSGGPSSIGVIVGMVNADDLRSGEVSNGTGTYVFEQTNVTDDAAASICLFDHKSGALDFTVINAVDTEAGSDSIISGSRSASAPAGTLHVGSTVGGANKFSGNIAEIIIAIGCTDGQRDAITDLLKSYYALPGG